MNDYVLKQSVPVFFNGKKINLSKTVTEIQKDGRTLSEDDSLFDGDSITISEKVNEPFIFQDVFKYVEIEKPDNPSVRFKLLRNEKETTFFEEIHPGDKLEIVWDHRDEEEQIH